MPKNEDGEFELILGNRQLLSVFFIVVVLFGVFFTMGYIVGRNNPPPLAAADSAVKESKPLVVDSPVRETSAPEQTKAAPPQSSAPVQTAVQQPEPTREETKTAPPAPKPEPVKTKPAAEKPADAAPSGTYLQLAATSQREADIEVEILRNKGFKAMAAEIPEKRGTFRVLVGPLGESNLGKTKSDLQNAGFPGDKAIRRTF